MEKVVQRVWTDDGLGMGNERDGGIPAYPWGEASPLICWAWEWQRVVALGVAGVTADDFLDSDQWTTGKSAPRLLTKRAPHEIWVSYFGTKQKQRPDLAADLARRPPKEVADDVSGLISPRSRQILKKSPLIRQHTCFILLSLLLWPDASVHLEYLQRGKYLLAFNAKCKIIFSFFFT